MSLSSIEIPMSNNLLKEEMKERIRQCIVYGSVEQGLALDFISSEGLLSWLLENPVDDDCLVAYRSLLRLGLPQYVERQHFLKLTRYSEYGAIYLMSGGAPNAPSALEPNAPPIVAWLVESTSKIYSDPKFCEKIQVISLECPPLENLTLEQVSLSIRAGNRPNLDPNKYRQLYINCDRVLPLSDFLDGELLKSITSRGHFLFYYAPKYWEHVGSKIYFPLIEKLVKECSMSGTTKQDLIKVKELFPSLETKLLQLSDLAYKIAMLPFKVQAYLLGFPIQYGLPSKEMIWTALEKLSSLGKKAYNEVLREEQRRSIEYLVPSVFNKPVERNDKDVLDELVYDYVPFDRLTAICGINLYHFTRNEFENIIKTEKNIYTGETLPSSVLEEAKVRLSLGEEFQLPKCETFLTLLEKVEHDALFENSGPSPKRRSLYQQFNFPSLSLSSIPEFSELLRQFSDGGIVQTTLSFSPV